MSPVKRGKPITGYERKDYKVFARVEPVEYENFMTAAKIAGDTQANALRKGMRLYVAMIKEQLKHNGG